jgi:NADPH-dependent 2,4-dienoyl-CoA reductase/sulfur reductase-like enzyme
LRLSSIAWGPIPSSPTALAAIRVYRREDRLKGTVPHLADLKPPDQPAATYSPHTAQIIRSEGSSFMVERYDVIVIGAGQAGLAMTWQLRERSEEHVVLERGQVGERWRTERWDSLAFQFPNWL